MSGQMPARRTNKHLYLLSSSAFNSGVSPLLILCSLNPHSRPAAYLCTFFLFRIGHQPSSSHPVTSSQRVSCVKVASSRTSSIFCSKTSRLLTVNCLLGRLLLYYVPTVCWMLSWVIGFVTVWFYILQSQRPPHFFPADIIREPIKLGLYHQPTYRSGLDESFGAGLYAPRFKEACD